MRILVVATKAPWPPVDGGRLILLTTIDALRDLGHHVTLVSPVASVPSGDVKRRLAERCEPHLISSPVRGGLASVVTAEASRTPVTVVRHAHKTVRKVVDALLRGEDFDVVHVEQQQALFGAAGAADAGVPVVIRAHNVESALWSFAARHRPPHLRWWFRRQAKRLERWEAASLRRADHTIAVTHVDAARLAELAGPSVPVTTVQAPFAGELPASTKRLAGRPAAVILASGAWQPNRDAVWRFAAEMWPATLRAVPDARLHVYGIPDPERRSPGVEWHDSPEESITAFPEGAVVVIPARHPTGVPMKCLEAWARGLPIVGSSLAAEQLGVEDGDSVLVADTAAGFADAFKRLADEPALRHRLVAGGRTKLRMNHDPGAVARRLVEVYRSCRPADRA